MFVLAMQWDRTAYLINLTQPHSDATYYTWNFSDGGNANNSLNPIHTFNGFDTLFIVCLTAENRCGTYQFCDTVFIDSLHQIGGFWTNISSQINYNKQNHHAKPSNKITEALKYKITVMVSYPNPFNQIT